MKKLILFTLLLGSAVIFCSCKKKSAEAAAPQTPETASSAAPSNPAAAPDSATAASAAQPAPIINTSVALTDVNEAIKAKDFKKAATTLIAVQQQPLTPQQAAAVHSQMVQFQGALAGAVANGDPNAKAAADQLRAASMH
jgi:hypothetical protein